MSGEARNIPKPTLVHTPTPMANNHLNQNASHAEVPGLKQGKTASVYAN